MALFTAACGLLLFGCRQWQSAEEKLPRMPAFRMRPNSIALEIAIANIEPYGATQLASLWDELDEQGISLERRRLLDRNGLRCGIASNQMPAVFRELIDANDPQRKLPPLFAHQQIQNGFGESHNIEVTAAVEQLSWSAIDADERIRSGNCPNALCLFDLKTFPRGNGTVDLELVPKISHGAPRAKLSSENDTFTLQPVLDEVALGELAFGCRLKPGETLIVGPTERASGLGEIFLGRHSGDSGTVRLLLVRLARTQMDDLFAPQKLQSPLTTAEQ